MFKNINNYGDDMQLQRKLLAALITGALLGAPAWAAINPASSAPPTTPPRPTSPSRCIRARRRASKLYLYSTATGSAEKARYVMTNTGGVWSVTLPTATLSSQGLGGTLYYGYRAWGPNWPYNASWTKGSSLGFVSDVDAAGNRFNPNKLLTDPYALELSHDPTTPTMTNGTIYASGATYRNIDSGSSAPKGIVLAGDTQSIGTKPTRALKDDVVYEAHVRGLTMNDASITAPTAAPTRARA
jgi:isoamylase